MLKRIDKNNSSLQTTANKKGKILTCTEGKTFPCGSACFTLGRNCKKNLDVNNKKKSTNIINTIKDNNSSKKPKEKIIQKKINKNQPNKQVELNQSKELTAEESIKELLKLDRELKVLKKETSSSFLMANKKKKKEIIQSLSEESKQISKSLSNLSVAEKKERIKNMMEKAREVVYSKNPGKLKGEIGETENEYGMEVNITLSAERKELFEKGLEEFNKLIGVNSINDKSIRIVDLSPSDGSKGRSHYNNQTNSVLIDKNSDVSIVVHEIAHFLEVRDPEITKKTKEFFELRTKNDKIEKLNEVSHSTYKDHEITKKDNWIDPYIGRIYEGSDSTEILSVGLEMMYKNPIDLAKKDPEFFKFIYNTVRGK